MDRHMKESFLNKLIFLVMKPLIYLLYKTPKEGAQTTLYGVLEDEDKIAKGGYFADCRVAKIKTEQCRDPEEAKKLWQKSEEVLGVEFNLG